MPHKHKRTKAHDGDNFDLPPSAVARPLPVGKTVETNFKARQKPRRDELRDSDTPRAFTRLMQFRKTGQRISGLDNGDEPRGKKRKRGQESKIQPVVESIRENVPKILRGERLAEFAARVDQALPLSGLAHKGKQVEGIRERQTKHERRLRKMQAAWREEEARLRDKEAEARELADEKEDERNALYEDKAAEFPSRRRKGKRKASNADDDDDPWDVLKRSREQPKGLHDVVQAPPQFKRVPKEKFKIRNGAKVDVVDIPNAAGSLRRREELGEARKSVIEGYRRMMDSKRTNV